MRLGKSEIARDRICSQSIDSCRRDDKEKSRTKLDLDRILHHALLWLPSKWKKIKKQNERKKR